MVEAKESYFDLTTGDQLQILSAVAPELGVTNAILEKDIWLCLVLEQLFTLPSVKPMTFKGGTSLSKVYRAIERFSEDIDITLDWRALHANPPSKEALAAFSGGQTDKLVKQINADLEAHILNVIKPGLEEALGRVSAAIRVAFETTDKGEQRDKLRIYYPVAAEKDNYILQSILIEFGAKNAIEPGELVVITPDVAAKVPVVSFPSANVHVLSPQRTFWEKATLIHDECHRPAEKQRANLNRMARHWYDLARLAHHSIGTQSLANVGLLKHVLGVKTRFYKYGFSRYDLCTNGNFRLIPDEPMLKALREDYAGMVDSKMFYGDVLNFDEVLTRLDVLQGQINQACLAVMEQPQTSE